MADLNQQEVYDWIRYQATGNFYYRDVLDRQVAPELWGQLRAICSDAVKEGVAARIDGKDGWYRPVDTSLEEILLENGDPQTVDLKLPMEMHNYGFVFAPALIVVAGEWNKGKTAYLLQCVNLNMDAFANNLFYFVSEGAELMKLRFKDMWGFIPKPLPFKMYRRLDRFSDVIRPDGLNIVDYLRVDMDKPWTVANELKAIYNKLRTGIAIVAMQKPMGRDIAFGGESTAWEPMLYISIGNGYAKFTKIKVPRFDEVDPYRIRFTFKIKKGVHFTDVSRIEE